jgi:hypothetical protein
VELYLLDCNRRLLRRLLFGSQIGLIGMGRERKKQDDDELPKIKISLFSEWFVL